MAMTIQQQTDAYRFFAIAFGAAPGVTYMNQIADAYAAGMTTKQIVNVYTTKPQFTSVYPNFYTNAQFANALIENVVGTSASAAAKAQAKADVEAALNVGWSRGDVIYQIFTNLANKPDGDADWGNTAKLLANQVAVAKYYTEVKLGDTTDLAVLKSVIAGVTPTTDVSTDTALDAVLADAMGQTFTLTTGLDKITGTSGNDTIFGTDSTLNTSDVIDGGNGNDTLNIFDVGSSSGVSFNPAFIKNVENLIYQAANGAANTLNLFGLSGLQSVTYQDLNSSAENVTINTKGNATSVTVKNAHTVAVSDTATTDTLASVSIDGNSGIATITSDALTSLSLANTNQNATVTAAAGTRALGVTVNNVTGGIIEDDKATTVTVTGSGAASSGFTLKTDAATSLAFAGDKALSLALADAGSNSAVVSSITSTNTAGVTITSSLGTSTAFTGGSGNDKVTVGATTKAIAMGAGDDTVNVTLSSGDLGTGGSIDGGDGTDTLGLTAADAAAAVTALGAKLTGFERIALSSATNQTIDMAKLNNINYVSEAGTGNTLTLNNFANNGTFVFTDASTATAINVKDAATGTNDVLNLVVTGSSTVTAGTVTVASVETINLTADDTATSPGGGFAHTMTLTAAAAKTLNVTGDAGVTLTLTGSTALETINTSGVTKGAVSVTTVGAGSVTLIGGDTDTTFDARSVLSNNSATITTGKGDDTITGGDGDDTINAGDGDNTIYGRDGDDTINAGDGNNTIYGGDGDDTINAGDGNNTIYGGAGDDTITTGKGDDIIDGEDGDDTINAGDGNDTITGGRGADTLTGGGGNDTFVFTALTDSTPAAYDTITDFVAKTATANGDVLKFIKTGIGSGFSALNHVFVANSGALALAALSSTDFGANKVNFALDASTGTLYVDSTSSTAGTSDGIADMAIVLTGVTTIDANAIVLA